MPASFAIAAPRLFDGDTFHFDAAVIVEAGTVAGIVPAREGPPGVNVEMLDAGIVAPGFVDLQVNGGGDALFNDDPSVAAIETICAAHVGRGTTALLVTLVSDTVDRTEAAIAAAVLAKRKGIPGFLGLHLEGPHLDPTRAGAHDASQIRQMQPTDLDRLLAAKAELDVLMVTVSPGAVTPVQIAAMANAGIVVSLGHSNADFATVKAAAEAGASAVTHLFNAMSPFSHRAPGMVGAALDTGGLAASVIADGVHVDVAALAVAHRAKRGPGHLFLVSDAMPTVGGGASSFDIGPRTAVLGDGQLRYQDGTLAGAHLDMAAAVRFCHDRVGIELEESLRMATAYPAEVTGSARAGAIAAGAAADLVHLGDDLTVESVWKAGARL